MGVGVSVIVGLMVKVLVGTMAVATGAEEKSGDFGSCGLLRVGESSHKGKATIVPAAKIPSAKIKALKYCHFSIFISNHPFRDVFRLPLNSAIEILSKITPKRNHV